MLHEFAHQLDSESGSNNGAPFLGSPERYRSWSETLARDFALRELYLWPINADQQGTPQQVRKVIDEVRKNDISVIFSESTISPAPALQVARETGAKYGGVLYVDSLSASDGPVPTYLDLLRVTSETVAKGLVE